VNTQTLTVALLLVLLIAPKQASADPAAPSPRLDRFTLQAASGPLVKSGGQTVSAAVGFSPISRLDFLVGVEQVRLPFQRETFSGRHSVTRGGTLTAVSGEVRASLFPPHRISPYALAGIGGGVSQPTVNQDFPNAVENMLQTAYAGAGLRIPISGGLTIFGDARAMMALEGGSGILGIWPVRAGVVWRF